jgi:hypothetical protein
MKLARTVAAIGLVLALAAPAAAVDTYDDGQANPLRLAAYVLHPVGYLAEWLVTRPLHRLFSQDDLEPISGHVPHQGFDYETYTEGLSTGVSYEDPYEPMLAPAE